MQQTEDKRWLILQMQNGVTYDELDEKHQPDERDGDRRTLLCLLILIK